MGSKWGLLPKQSQLDEHPIRSPWASDQPLTRKREASRELSRIWNTGRARVVPCTPEGRPLGPALEGDARVLRPGEEAAALEAGLLGLPGSSNQLAYVEVRPLGQWTVAGPAP